MIKINLAIRQKGKQEADSFNLLISDSKNLYGFWTCKITDDSLTEIFSLTKENLPELQGEIEKFIKGIGKVINVHELKTPVEIEIWIERLRNL